METVTVTIGRNVGDAPLPPEAWNAYVSDTRQAVEAATSELWAHAPYRGEWEGVAEDAFIYFGALAGPDSLGALRQRLATLATFYGQDAIGLAAGTGELVENFASGVPAVEGVTA